VKLGKRWNSAKNLVVDDGTVTQFEFEEVGCVVLNLLEVGEFAEESVEHGNVPGVGLNGPGDHLLDEDGCFEVLEVESHVGITPNDFEEERKLFLEETARNVVGGVFGITEELAELDLHLVSRVGGVQLGSSHVVQVVVQCVDPEGFLVGVVDVGDQEVGKAGFDVTVDQHLTWSS
jgi:hypothetical protein